MNNITSDGQLDLRKKRRVPADSRNIDRYQVKSGDVLFNATNSPDLVGKAAYFPGLEEPVVFSNHFLRLRPDADRLDGRFLSRWLNVQFQRGRFKGMCRQWVNQATVNRESLLAMQMRLPPLHEQKRIAEILDKADVLRVKRRAALAQLDTLTQSIFIDMFGDPVTNPKGWEQCVVGDVVYTAKDGPHVSPTYAESGVPFLSARHIKPGEVVWEGLKYIDQDEANRQWKKCKPEFGDILYTKGGTTGVAARVTSSEPFAVWVHVALLKPIKKKVHPIWMEAMLNSAYCYAQSQRYTHGIANRDLGLKRMVKIQLYLPPLSEQHDFAAIVESIEQQKASQRAHLAELDALFASLQSRAFRGEL